MPSSNFQAECTYTDVLKPFCYKEMFITVYLKEVLQEIGTLFPLPPLPSQVKYLLIMFALGSMDFQSHFYQRQGQDGAAIGLS